MIQSMIFKGSCDSSYLRLLATGTDSAENPFTRTTHTKTIADFVQQHQA